MGIESFGDIERAIDQEADARKDGYHFENLFDQNEDEAGEKINPVTGERFVNDSDGHVENSTTMSINKKGKLLDLKKELAKDLATKYFLEQGLDEFGNEIKPAKKKKAA